MSEPPQSGPPQPPKRPPTSADSPSDASKGTHAQQKKRFRPTRRKARKYALDVLYAAELMDRSIWVALDDRVTDDELPLAAYSRQLIEGVASHLTAIDDAIAAGLAQDWTLDRMPRLDRNLARIAVYEFVYGDVPAAVATAEAAALADELSTDGSSRFLQGLLGGVEKAVAARAERRLGVSMTHRQGLEVTSPVSPSTSGAEERAPAKLIIARPSQVLREDIHE